MADQCPLLAKADAGGAAFEGQLWSVHDAPPAWFLPGPIRIRGGAARYFASDRHFHRGIHPESTFRLISEKATHYQRLAESRSGQGGFFCGIQGIHFEEASKRKPLSSKPLIPRVIRLTKLSPLRSQIIVAKDRFVLSRGDYHWQHEPCWYAVRKTGKGHWAGDRKQPTLWQIANKDQDATTVHGTQKPVECMRRPILNISSPGQAVFESFRGPVPR